MNIPIDRVKKIINGYIDYCKDLLRAGYEVNFLGLCKITPNNLRSAYNTTLAYDCLQVSRRVAIPYNTVFTVIDSYLESLRADLASYDDVNLRGLCTLRIISTSEGCYTVHSKASTKLKEQGIDAKVASNIYMKHIVRGY